jgi:hypothetical protein
MGDNKDYDPEVFKRLELVQKQFKVNTQTQKKEQSRQKRRMFWQNLSSNQAKIIRWTAFAVMGMLLVAVFLVLILRAFQ